MSNELDLINSDLGRLYAQASEPAVAESLAAKLVGPGKPAWTEEARNRNPPMVATDTLRKAAAKRYGDGKRAKQDQLDREMIQRFYPDGNFLLPEGELEKSLQFIPRDGESEFDAVMRRADQTLGVSRDQRERQRLMDVYERTKSR